MGAAAQKKRERMATGQRTTGRDTEREETEAKKKMEELNEEN